MNKVSWKGGALLAPVPPVMVSCGSMQQPNIITVGWTGITNTIPPKTYISIRPERFSYHLLKETGVFVVNLTTESLVRAADFCGARSGKDVNKWKETGLTPLAAPETGCPMIAESPLSLECQVTDVIPLGSHDMFLADILSVQVDPRLIDKAGRLCLDRAKLAAYAHGEYFALGEKLGSFGFSVRKKPKQQNRNSRRGEKPNKSAHPARKKRKNTTGR